MHTFLIFVDLHYGLARPVGALEVNDNASAGHRWIQTSWSGSKEQVRREAPL